MATGKKLPSGSWRCRVFSHYEEIKQPDGTTKKKSVYKSFTSDNPTKQGKKEVELAAAQYAANRKITSISAADMTVGAAMDDYIAKRTAVLSPRTIMSYKTIRNKNVGTLVDIKLCNLTKEDVQEAVNIASVNHAPKTVKNIHGFISVIVKQYHPDLALNTALPKKVRPNIYVPSDKDIQALIAYVKDSDMELPVLLAAFGPMRRGEICALDTKNIKNNVVHVCCNKVKDGNGGWIIRQPKTYAGDRYIKYPDFVADLWKNKKGLLVEMNPNKVTEHFRKTLISIGLPHFRFHDLRHYSASIQHALGVPDSYIMQRGGWGNDGVLKAVYRHTMESKEAEMNQIANKHFEELYATKYDTKK